MLMFSAVKRVSGLPKKGIALVSLNLFGNQRDQSDAVCDDWAELRGCGLILWALLGDSSVGLGWVPHDLERMEPLVGMEMLPFSGSRFWP